MIYKDLILIIPAYNEESSIGHIVEEARKIAKVLVVDDCSTDATLNILIKKQVDFVRNRINQGYDKTILIGLQNAIKLNYKYAITIDADGQHKICDVSRVYERLNDGCEIVLAERKNLQRFGEKAFSFITKILWGIRDPLTGMKGYKLDYINKNKIKKYYDSVGTYMLMVAIKKKGKIGLINIETNKRNGESTFGNGIRINIKILNALILGITIAC